MAAVTYTVQQYLDATKPIPAGTTVYIVDTAAAIAALSAAALDGMSANRVVSINATDNALSLTLDQIEALGTVRLSGDDTVKILDTDANLAGLTPDKVASLNAKGVDIIAATDKTLQISEDIASAIAATGLRFDGEDSVTASDNGKLDFTPAEIAALSLKGVDLVDLAPEGMYGASLTIDQAIAISKSNIAFVPANTIRLQVSDSEMAKLTPEILAKLSAKQIDSLGAGDQGAFSLTLAQYSALNGLTLENGDLVTLKLSAMDLALLKDSQIAAFANHNVDEVAFSASSQTLLSLSAENLASLVARGVTVLDATENSLALTLAQYNALSDMKFTPEDTVTVSMRLSEIDALTQADITDIHNSRVDKVILTESGQTLGAFTAEQITALIDKGVGAFDAADNRLTLTSDQYYAMGNGRLTSSDVVTIVANDDFYGELTSIDNLILTGSAIFGVGNDLANTITGNDKNNTLGSLGGNDVLNGGFGKDNLYGGSGKDIFVFNTKLASSNVDRLADFDPKYDTIHLENRYFTKLKGGKLASSAFWKGTKAHDSNDRVIYDAKKGNLFFDADGTGSKYKPVLFATTLKNLKMSAADFYVI